MPSLNPRQLRFINEYMVDLNATQAAIRAGYTHPDVQGPRLLGNVRVSTEIQQRQNKLQQKAEVTVERVVKEYARIAFLDPSMFFDDRGNMLQIHEMPEDARRTITGTEVEELFEGRGEDRAHVGTLKKFRFANKTAALDSLARTLGLFQDSTNIGVNSFSVHIHLNEGE